MSYLIGPMDTNGQQTSFMTSTKLASCAILNSATLFYIISFSSDKWIASASGRTDNLAFGLWKVCYDTTNVTGEQTEGQTERVCTKPTDFINEAWGNEWVSGTQAVMCLGLITSVLSTALMDLYMVLPLFKTSPAPIYASLCAAFATAAFSVIAIFTVTLRQGFDTVFHDTKLDWGYALGIIALILSLVGYGFLLLEFSYMIKKRPSRMAQRVEFSSPPSIPNPEGQSGSNADLFSANYPRQPGNGSSGSQFGGARARDLEQHNYNSVPYYDNAPPAPVAAPRAAAAAKPIGNEHLFQVSSPTRRPQATSGGHDDPCAKIPAYASSSNNNVPYNYSRTDDSSPALYSRPNRARKDSFGSVDGDETNVKQKAGDFDIEEEVVKVPKYSIFETATAKPSTSTARVEHTSGSGGSNGEIPRDDHQEDTNNNISVLTSAKQPDRPDRKQRRNSKFGVLDPESDGTNVELVGSKPDDAGMQATLIMPRSKLPPLKGATPLNHLTPLAGIKHNGSDAENMEETNFDGTGIVNEAYEVGDERNDQMISVPHRRHKHGKKSGRSGIDTDTTADDNTSPYSDPIDRSHTKGGKKKLSHRTTESGPEEDSMIGSDSNEHQKTMGMKLSAPREEHSMHGLLDPIPRAKLPKMGTLAVHQSKNDNAGLDNIEPGASSNTTADIESNLPENRDVPQKSKRRRKHRHHRDIEESRDQIDKPEPEESTMSYTGNKEYSEC